MEHVYSDVSSGRDEGFLPPKRFTRRTRGGVWREHLAGALVPFVGLAGVCLFFGLILAAPIKTDWTNCNPGRTTYEVLLTYSVSFGQFSLPVAKTIDVCFDVVVGRGGQFVNAAYACRIFKISLQRSMEAVPVPYRTFTALQFQAGELASIWDLLRDLRKLKSKRAVAIIVWIVISTMWLIGYPTLASAMTGYTARSYSWMPLTNDTMIQQSKCDTSSGRYILLDGARIGLNNNTVVSPDGDLNNATTNYLKDYYTILDEYKNDPELENNEGYWFDVPPNFSSSTSTFNVNQSSINLPAPLLNIEVATWNCYGEWLTDHYVSTNWVCLATDTYQWGFSPTLLATFLCLNFVFVLGMYIMWWDAWRHSDLVAKNRTAGTYRAVLDLADAIREDLGPNLCAYSDPDLAAAVTGRKNGIKYYADEPELAAAAVKPSYLGLSSAASGRVKLDWEQNYGGARDMF